MVCITTSITRVPSRHGRAVRRRCDVRRNALRRRGGGGPRYSALFLRLHGTRYSPLSMNLPAESLLDAIDRLRETDRRFAREAYLFVVSSLGAAVAKLPVERRADPERRHLHGGEVVAAVIELALAEFGPLAPGVFAEWGMTCGRSVGDIVFQLVDAGHLSTQPGDCIEDFDVPADLLALLSAGRESRSGSRDRV